jgi:hypothetical protein
MQDPSSFLMVVALKFRHATPRCWVIRLTAALGGNLYLFNAENHSGKHLWEITCWRGGVKLTNIVSWGLDFGLPEGRI